MSFAYIQRLEDANSTPSTPFDDSPDRTFMESFNAADGNTSLEYMGCAELESGIVSESGRRLVAAQRLNGLQIASQTLARPTYVEPVYFVCTTKQGEETLQHWNRWASQPHPYTVEDINYFRDLESTLPAWARSETIAWWDVEEDLIWTRERKVAERILGAFIALAAQEE